MDLDLDGVGRHGGGSNWILGCKRQLDLRTTWRLVRTPPNNR